MKGHRLDAPNARPFDGAAFFLGEAFARLHSLTVHRGENGGIQVALIERDLAAAGDGGGDAGKGFEAADGADGIGMPSGDRADFEGEFCGGGEGVAALVHGRRARVRRLSVEGDRVAFDAFGAEDDAEGQSEPFKHRALLNVQLEIGGGMLALAGGFGETVDVDTASFESVLQADTVLIGAAAVRRDGVRAGERR